MNCVLHIPHASRTVPPEVREQILLTEEELDHELLAMTDAHTDALFHDSVPGACELIFPVSRLVVDPERFADDSAEPMSRVGMGVIYTRTSSGGSLRRPLRDEERVRLLGRYYEPHHAALTRAAREALDATGSCLIVDCHSFPAVPLPYELDQDPERPDICLGADAVHTPAPVVNSLRRAFEAEGLNVLVNRPFRGALVPGEYYRRNRRVSSVMVEVNRRLYMDETTGQRLPAFEQVRAILRKVLGHVGSYSDAN